MKCFVGPGWCFVAVVAEVVGYGDVHDAVGQVDLVAVVLIVVVVDHVVVVVNVDVVVERGDVADTKTVVLFHFERFLCE